MKRRIIPIAGLLIVLLGGCGSQGSAPPPAQAGVLRASVVRDVTSAPAADLKTLRASDSGFAGRMLGRLAQGNQTVVFSPYSIADTLAMAAAGARGATAAQIGDALGFAQGPSRLAAGFDTVDRSLASSDGPGVTLQIANALYGQRGLAFRSDFLSMLARYYGAGMRVVDFGQTAQATSTINAWVAAHTAGKITHLLSSQDLDASTALVLVDAVYLKAKWLSPFAPTDTTPAPFHAPGATVPVPTMHQTGTFPYLAGRGYGAVELPYRGDRLAFDVLLPDPGRLPALLQQIGHGGPDPLLAGLLPQRVELSLPKLLLRTQVGLAPVLKALGITDAFDPAHADFSGIAGRPGALYLKTVEHAAYIRVDETGTEAAAATAGVTESSAAAPSPAVAFDVDRPFLFVLRDTQTGAILFTGEVSRP